MTTFTRLRSGQWGIRSTEALSPGQLIAVEKRDGTTTEVVVDRVIWTDGRVWLAAVAAGQRRARKHAPPPPADPGAAAMSESACGADAYDVFR